MTTQILCRVDTNRIPVVFLTDSIDYDKGHILSWTKGEPQVVSLSYYHTTLPLSAADEEILRQRYARAFADDDVVVRHRLPRTERVRENILSKPGRKAGSEPKLSVEQAPVAPVQAVAVPVDITPTPQQLFAAIEGMRVEFAQQFANALAELKATPVARKRPPAKKVAMKVATRKPSAKRGVPKV